MSIQRHALPANTNISIIHYTVHPHLIIFHIGTRVNGSSPTGNCRIWNRSNEVTVCRQPTSSVLFDGNRLPTLTGLDGNMWASQLLTINTKDPSTTVTFDFTDTPGYDGVQRVEVLMFNCLQWGIGSSFIFLLGADDRSPVAMRTILTSCDSLVRVCISATVSQPVLTLRFVLHPNSDWLHLAEVTFYASGSICPPSNVILTPPPPTTLMTTTTPGTPYIHWPTL